MERSVAEGRDTSLHAVGTGARNGLELGWMEGCKFQSCMNAMGELWLTAHIESVTQNSQKALL